MNTVVSQYVSFKESNDYEDDFICKIEPPPPEWVTFEIKTTMKDKYGPNATPTSGKPSKIQNDFINNIKINIFNATESLKAGKNDYNLTKEQIRITKGIRKDLNKTNVVGYKLTVAIDDSFNISGNNKYPHFYYLEGLDK
ncbi:TPA: hypothetical protein U2M17_002854 [Providencia stuartii]|uniref:hypothetical protein n=1 Tax=Providencia stuartii TaxID=588 RepID=UPI0005364E3E|nr:hypothetical protein [Providencia stuartii]AXO19096.1 hypothetical protein MC79_011095 [Providencia stuartii]MBN5593737.1 hypothetical protein [Providencia stuartii]HEM6907100.1 hypothetical protein [Providencia stuartii]HEM7152678.1 hypothetical protein [Providencia stuartii]HEM7520729.1 hypothetical protein [Providencia stuartii]